jgi:hypothetical protein
MHILLFLFGLKNHSHHCMILNHDFSETASLKEKKMFKTKAEVDKYVSKISKHSRVYIYNNLTRFLFAW